MLPLSDSIPARRFPIVNVLLIVANFAVWIFYELPQLNTAVYHASFYPCTLDSGSANGGGVAFSAHVGGFIFGLLVARLLARTGPGSTRGATALHGVGPRDPLAATGEARRPWRRCASASDRV